MAINVVTLLLLAFTSRLGERMERWLYRTTNITKWDIHQQSVVMIDAMNPRRQTEAKVPPHLAAPWPLLPAMVSRLGDSLHGRWRRALTAVLQPSHPQATTPNVAPWYRHTYLRR